MDEIASDVAQGATAFNDNDLLTLTKFKFPNEKLEKQRGHGSQRGPACWFAKVIICHLGKLVIRAASERHPQPLDRAPAVSDRQPVHQSEISAASVRSSRSNRHRLTSVLPENPVQGPPRIEQAVGQLKPFKRNQGHRSAPTRPPPPPPPPPIPHTTPPP